MSATRYQPVHTTGKRGPIFDFATEAVVWNLGQDDWQEWKWNPVHALPNPAPLEFVNPSRRLEEDEEGSVGDCARCGDVCCRRVMVESDLGPVCPECEAMMHDRGTLADVLREIGLAGMRPSKFFTNEI